MPRKRSTAKSSKGAFRRMLAYQESIDVIETLAREKYELAEFMEVETQMSFEEAYEMIDRLCDQIIPGYRGIEKVTTFRREIRDRLKRALITEATQ